MARDLKRFHGYTLAAICVILAAFSIIGLALRAPGEIPTTKAFEPVRKLVEFTGQTISTTAIDIAPRAAKILIVGDIMLDRNVAARTRAAKDPNYIFAKLPIGWLASFDQTVGNLEGPVGERKLPPVKEIDFLFAPSTLPILKQQGFDIFSQANNHALDQGSAGYAESVHRLSEAGFITFGHHVKDDEIALATTTVGGFALAYLGYNTTDNPLDRQAAARVIAKASTETDYVIAYVHWGNEYRSQPDASSIDTAHWLIDQGVDIVIGGHPHWTQGFSTYKDKPIAWSLGNFIFDQDWSKETQKGLALVLELAPDQVSFLPMPVAIEKSQPRILEGMELETRLKYLSDISDPKLRDAILAGRIDFPN